jgi:hypothetical protein
MHTELAYRENGGIAVALLWDRETNELTVRVADGRTGDSFSLAVRGRDGLDVFYHPYAYVPFTREAGRSGVGAGDSA